MKSGKVDVFDIGPATCKLGGLLQPSLFPYVLISFFSMSSQITTDQLLELASKAGEVRYARLGVENNGSRNALVEYSEQPSIIPALKLHHLEHMGKQIK